MDRSFLETSSAVIGSPRASSLGPDGTNSSKPFFTASTSTDLSPKTLEKKSLASSTEPE